MLATQRNDELLVRFLLAVLVQHAHVRLAPIQSLAGLAQTARQAVVDECKFEDALESFDYRHLALIGTGVGTDFDLFSGGNGGFLFSVRLDEGLVTTEDGL